MSDERNDADHFPSASDIRLVEIHLQGRDRATWRNQIIHAEAGNVTTVGMADIRLEGVITTLSGQVDPAVVQLREVAEELISIRSEADDLYRRRRAYLEAQVDEALHNLSRERARTILDNFSVFIPQRVSNEELGDYLEDINRQSAQGQTWQINWKIVSAMVYVTVSTFGFFMSNLFGRSKKAN